MGKQVVEHPRPKEESGGLLRQETYYIFYPSTQTVEPITIAQFEETTVTEEVVVSEENGTGRKEEGEEGIIAAVDNDQQEDVQDPGGCHFTQGAAAEPMQSMEKNKDKKTMLSSVKKMKQKCQ